MQRNENVIQPVHVGTFLSESAQVLFLRSSVAVFASVRMRRNSCVFLSLHGVASISMQNSKGIQGMTPPLGGQNGQTNAWKCEYRVIPPARAKVQEVERTTVVR